MSVVATTHGPFKIDHPRIPASAAHPLERLLAFDRLNALYRRVIASHPQDLNQFLQATLDELSIHCHVAAEDLKRVPATGPLVIVANHPFGAIEGIVLASMLTKVRADFSILANSLLHHIPELRGIFTFVNPFGGDAATRSNIAPLRQSLRRLRDGHLLAVFPAGEVSHLRLREASITDSAWNPGIARLIRLSGAAVLPIFFDGSNSSLFHLAGLVHPRLRTALLIREFLARKNGRIDLRIGSLIPARRLTEVEDDTQLAEYLRRRTYLLKHRPTKAIPQYIPQELEQIIAPVESAKIVSDVASLPADHLLVETPEHSVYCARANQIPSLMTEIGRVREITFRATGEGTGKACDIDTFDYDYLHLFVWSKRANEIIGGYRIGLTDQLLAAKGRQGLYTSTLFDYSDQALRRINPALELGRSFVAPKHQKSYAPLLLLWKGIGAFVVRNPRYRHLFGPVSISNTYQSISKQLMIRFLRLRHSEPNARSLVTPRNPFRDRSIQGWDDASIRALLRDDSDVSDLVSEIEPDQKGIPVLIRQYLKLGARMLAFNVDPKFSDVVDGLLMVDLTKTDAKLLERYMGKEGRESFLAHHS